MKSGHLGCHLTIYDLALFPVSYLSLLFIFSLFDIFSFRFALHFSFYFIFLFLLFFVFFCLFMLSSFHFFGLIITFFVLVSFFLTFLLILFSIDFSLSFLFTCTPRFFLYPLTNQCQFFSFYLSYISKKLYKSK